LTCLYIVVVPLPLQLGGFDGVTHLSSVETYSPEAHAWLPAPSMVRARSNFGVGVLEGVL